MARLDSPSLVVSFTGPPPGSVVLLRAGGRLVHRGTAASRGPAAPGWSTVPALGIGDSRAAANNFVAGWFGSPFDAVNVGRMGQERLTWGIWGFAGTRLARCLSRWKARAPESYGELLTSTGIDVAPGPDGSTPVLVLGTATIPTARGRRAERVISADPRFVTALARAGRDAEGQLAQIASIAADVLEPTLAIPAGVAGSAPRLGDLIRSPRGLSVLLYLDLKLGRATVHRIARTDIPGRPRPADERGWLDHAVAQLTMSGRSLGAHNVMRIVSSPEFERG